MLQAAVRERLEARKKVKKDEEEGIASSATIQEKLNEQCDVVMNLRKNLATEFVRLTSSSSSSDDSCDSILERVLHQPKSHTSGKI